MKSRHRKVIHEHARARTWKASCRREAACDGACGVVFRQGCHQRVDRPHAPRNLRFPAVKVTDGGDGEEIRRRRVPKGE